MRIRQEIGPVGRSVAIGAVYAVSNGSKTKGSSAARSRRTRRARPAGPALLRDHARSTTACRRPQRIERPPVAWTPSRAQGAK